MGYHTDYTGELKFTHPLAEEQITDLQVIFEIFL